MGTDIHGVFQRFDQTLNEWRDVSSAYDERRHYQLFSVLAGVRNGYGFAGVPTGMPVDPISEPRGIPSDFEIVHGDWHPVDSPDVLINSDFDMEVDGESHKWMGDHSYSWLEGDELLAWYESAPVVTKTGIVSRNEWAEWDQLGPPSSWCGDIEGPNVSIFSAFNPDPDWTHTRAFWDSDLRAELKYFFDEVARLTAEHGRIRFVFGFDS